MKTTDRLASLKGEHRPICLAIGYFDGVHRGHRLILLSTIAAARDCGGVAWCLTFASHPLSVIAPSKAPKLLTSREHKTQLLTALGMDGCLILKFTRAFAAQEPEEFVHSLCKNAPTLRSISIGDNWRFGRNGAGDTSLLTTLMGRSGVSVAALQPVMWRGAPVSSTRIRTSVSKGQLDGAYRMLGRPFSILGTVGHGLKIGRTLGFPTANIHPQTEMVPPNGIYAVQANIGRGIVVDGVLSIGVRPTFEKEKCNSVTYELHIPGFSGNLYGRKVEVHFISRLRDERKFDSPASLVRQIKLDIKAASRAIFDSANKII
ncbi:MAG: bifunctional riboflavin kinase/FAD synthetase [bacterium]